MPLKEEQVANTTLEADALNQPEGSLSVPAQVAFKPSRNFLLAFISICIITLAAALDATSLSIALPLLTDQLHGTAIESFWSGTSFLLTSAVFQPVISGLSHVFGRKSLIMVSSLFFAVGSLIAALAVTFTMILVGRSIQGIGGGGILALGEIIVTDLVPLASRGTWFGYLGSMWALGSVAGPLIGGAFAQYVSWQWIFWINLPILGLGSVAIAFFLKLNRLPDKLLTKVGLFDWIGSAIFVASTVSFLLPITWGGVMFPWDSWRTLFPLLLGVAGIVSFVLFEWRITRRVFHPVSQTGAGTVEPIIRFSIFSNMTLNIMYFETVLHGIVLWSLLYFLPLYYEAIKGYSPMIAGVALLPETGLVAPVSVLAAFICTATGQYRWTLWVGWFMTTFGAGLLFLLGPNTSVASWIFLNVVVSAGTGILFPSMGLGIQAACRPEDSGHAAGFFSFLRVFGQSIGVAISGVAFQNQLRQELFKYPAFAVHASEYSRDATSLVNVIKEMEPGLDKTDLIQAYSDGLHVIWLLITVVSGIGLISSGFIKAYTLNQEHKTKQKMRSS